MCILGSFQRFLFSFFLLFITNIFSETIAQQPVDWVDGRGGEIATLAELRWLSETWHAWNENWILTANIDASDTRNWNVITRDSLNGADTVSYLDTLGFNPIGDGQHFTGTFDGNGYHISNLYIHRIDDNMVGLFGNLDGDLRNIDVRNADIKGRLYVGNVVGIVWDNGGIVNSRADGKVAGINHSVGGFAGANYGSILSSNVEAEVIGGKWSTGGFVGSLHKAGTIKHCYSNSNVIGVNEVGGFIGGVYSEPQGIQAQGVQTQNFALGTVKGDSAVGGFVGHHLGSITNSFTLANVEARTHAGGFVGQHGGYTKNSYAANTVQAASFGAAFAGRIYSNEPPQSTYYHHMESNYFDHSINKLNATGNGGLGPVYLKGLSSEEFSDYNSFEEWSFDSIWYIDSLPYDTISRPYFKSEFDLFTVHLAKWTDNGSIVGDTLQTISSGQSSKRATAIPDSGYSFVGWVDSAQNVISQDSSILIDPVISDTTLFAKFAELANDNSYLVSVYGADQNELFSVNHYRVDHGDDTDTIKAFPSEGFHLFAWTISKTGEVISTENSFVIKNVQKAYSIQAVFERNIYNVVFESMGNGAISGESEQEVRYAYNSDSVVAVPYSGYHFSGWYVGNQRVSLENPLVLNHVTSDSTLRAFFTENTYSVHLHAGSNGGLEGSAFQRVDHFDSTTSVTALPDSNYNFIAWVNTSGDTVSRDNPLVLKNLTSDTSVTAIFIPHQFRLKLQTDEHGELEGESTQLVPYLTSSKPVTARPNPRYHFVSWQNEEGDVISENNPIVINSMVSDSALTAVFAVNTYEVNFVADSNGVVFGKSPQIINENNSAEAVLALPDKGYTFSGWYDQHNAMYSNDNPLVVDDVIRDGKFIAQFSLKKTYTLHYRADDGGSVVGDTLQYVEDTSDAKSVVAIPHEGYHFLVWINKSDVVVSEVQDYKAVNVVADDSFTAIFEVNEYTIDYEVVGGGTIIGADLDALTHGDSLKVIFTPEFNHDLDSVFINGEKQVTMKSPISNEYYLDLVTSEDILIEAYFSLLVQAPLSSDLLEEVVINPIWGRGALEIRSANNAMLTLIDTQGRVLQQGEIQSSSPWVLSNNVTGSGMFFLHFSDGKQVFVKSVWLP